MTASVQTFLINLVIDGIPYCPHMTNTRQNWLVLKVLLAKCSKWLGTWKTQSLTKNPLKIGRPKSRLLFSGTSTIHFFSYRGIQVETFVEVGRAFLKMKYQHSIRIKQYCLEPCHLVIGFPNLPLKSFMRNCTKPLYNSNQFQLFCSKWSSIASFDISQLHLQKWNWFSKARVAQA